MTFSEFPEFLRNADGMKMHLQIGDVSVSDSSIVMLKDRVLPTISPKKSCLIELHPVFSHMTVMLIQGLAETGHGEFVTRTKKGKYEATVELGGHISQRYCLSIEELKEIQYVYDHIIETWIAWRLSRNKS
jgi:hypothetical protein